MTSEDLLQRLRDFDAAHPGLLPPTFDVEASEALLTNSKWLRVQGVDACNWLKARAAAAPAPGGVRGGAATPAAGGQGGAGVADVLDHHDHEEDFEDEEEEEEAEGP
jgi:hypothetical protein